MKEKVRIYLLAKTLNVESNLIIDHCRDLGYDVKNQLSSLETDQIEEVKSRIQKGVKPGSANLTPIPSSATTSGSSAPVSSNRGSKKMPTISQSSKPVPKSGIAIQEAVGKKVEAPPLVSETQIGAKEIDLTPNIVTTSHSSLHTLEPSDELSTRSSQALETASNVLQKSSGNKTTSVHSQIPSDSQLGGPNTAEGKISDKPVPTSGIRSTSGVSSGAGNEPPFPGQSSTSKDSRSIPPMNYGSRTIPNLPLPSKSSSRTSDEVKKSGNGSSTPQTGSPSPDGVSLSDSSSKTSASSLSGNVIVTKPVSVSEESPVSAKPNVIPVSNSNIAVKPGLDSSESISAPSPNMQKSPKPVTQTNLGGQPNQVQPTNPSNSLNAPSTPYNPSQIPISKLSEEKGSKVDSANLSGVRTSLKNERVAGNEKTNGLDGIPNIEGSDSFTSSANSSLTPSIGSTVEQGEISRSGSKDLRTSNVDSISRPPLNIDSASPLGSEEFIPSKGSSVPEVDSSPLTPTKSTSGFSTSGFPQKQKNILNLNNRSAGGFPRVAAGKNINDGGSGLKNDSSDLKTENKNNLGPDGSKDPAKLKPGSELSGADMGQLKQQRAGSKLSPITNPTTSPGKSAESGGITKVPFIDRGNRTPQGRPDQGNPQIGHKPGLKNDLRGDVKGRNINNDRQGEGGHQRKTLLDRAGRSGSDARNRPQNRSGDRPLSGNVPGAGHGQQNRQRDDKHSLKAPGQATGGQGAGHGLNRDDKEGNKSPGAPARQFSPEELKGLREGKSVSEIIRLREIQSQVDNTGNEDLTNEDDSLNKRGPGSVSGREERHKERAKRQEKRKEKASVIIKDGHVEVVEESYGAKRSKRHKVKKQPATVERKGKVLIRMPITVRSLSEAIGVRVSELILKLKDLTNSLLTINSNITIEMAELLAMEKGVELDIRKPKDLEEDLLEEFSKASAQEELMVPRSPIVTIMGHVDHGKTSLLDRIRQMYGHRSDVVSTEAGGITQVIRAWRVEKDGKAVTFLDTPGHEAFTKMRARGATVTDIAVIVVAADDGIMPQTEEAINHAKAAGVSIVVAINKIDLPNANIKKTEQQLYSLSLLPDNMGGDCQFVYTSASTGQGIDELLETLSLVAEIKELKANPNRAASGVCLEAHLSGDEGVIATLLVQQGTLKKGDVIICGACYGRVRAMYDDLGNSTASAGPSVPVQITGLDDVPNADDHFHSLDDLSQAREIAKKRKDRQQELQYYSREAIRLEDIGRTTKRFAELKVILKAEAKGSIEAIKKELEKLQHEEVRVRVLHAAIGGISENDIQLALASPEDSIVIGFNVAPDDLAIKLAEERGIPIREYNIIYNLTNDVKSALEGKLKPREEVIHLGRAVIREVYRISKVGSIAGCYVTQGIIERSSKIRVIRDGIVVYPPAEKIVGLASLKRFKDDVKEVREGFECGMKIDGYDDIKEGDVIEAYRVEQVMRTL